MPDSELLAAVTVRPAEVADAAAWARFLAEAQGRTYAELAPEDFAAQRLAEIDTSAEELAVAFAADNDAVRLIAEHEGSIVGIAAAGPAPQRWEVAYGYADAPADRQLERLYLHHDWHGTGLADRLLAGVLDERAVYLWIIDGNLRAQRFYARRGFADLPEEIPAGQAWGSIPMHRMLRPALR